jgi:hypothetical protein
MLRESDGLRPFILELAEPVDEDVRFTQIHREAGLDKSEFHGGTCALRTLERRIALANPH